VFKKAPSILAIKCSDALTEANFPGDAGKVFSINCPKDCSKDSEGDVFGEFMFAEESSICKAAILDGLLTNMGGNIEIKIEKG
jgi:hypothetical protein